MDYSDAPNLISADPTVERFNQSTCQGPTCRAAKSETPVSTVCGRCRFVTYCSQKCLLDDYPQHGVLCKDAESTANELPPGLPRFPTLHTHFINVYRSNIAKSVYVLRLLEPDPNRHPIGVFRFDAHGHLLSQAAYIPDLSDEWPGHDSFRSMGVRIYVEGYFHYLDAAFGYRKPATQDWDGVHRCNNSHLKESRMYTLESLAAEVLDLSAFEFRPEADMYAVTAPAAPEPEATKPSQ